MFLGLVQEAWPPCLLGAFPSIFWLFFSSFIYCVHAFEFRARSMTPLSFGSFFFYLLAIFFSILLYYVRAYQNQCYMCTKISIIQWLAPSGRLIFRKNSFHLNVVPKTTCWNSGHKCWELKLLTSKAD
jgi:hypothetical protein